MLIAIDRFIATVFPLKASLISGKVRAALLSAIWLVSTAYCVPPLKYSFVEAVGHETFCRFSWSSLAIMFNYIAGMALFNISPMIAIIILYYRIMQVLTRRVELGNNTTYINTQQRRINKQKQNIMRIFKSVVLAFTVSFLLLNANETSIARGQKALGRSLALSLLPSLDFVKYFIYGNYNVPYNNAADQCIRLSPKMASFAAAENTQDNVFLFLRSKDTFMEFRIEGNKSSEYSTAEKSRH